MAQSTPQTSAQWVENALASLLSAPRISIPRIPGFPMGPGPIDLFGTRFINTFTSDAKGVVDGEQVDRDGLEEKLLDLQRHYNPDTVKFHADDSDSCAQVSPCGIGLKTGVDTTFSSAGLFTRPSARFIPVDDEGLGRV